jgi:type II secretory pathway component GspD/PulD (secretin)
MKSGRTLRRLLAGPIVVSVLVTNAWGESLQVIDLQYRTAQEIIPVLQPLLEPGAALSGQDYKLFVRTSSANLAEIRAALAQIDRRPRQLVVSVGQGAREEFERLQTAVSGTIRTGDAVASVNERPQGASNVTIRATDASQRANNGGVASVQVMEGASAFIATGSSAPIVTTVAAGAGRRPWAVSSSSYRNLSSGFLVTPRVNERLVVLDVEQQHEGIDGGQIETQRLTTQVSARLGEWVQLGRLSESATSTSRGILNRAYQTRSDERSIWVKVDAP